MVFTLKNVSKIFGINHNRCRQWVSLGYIKPSIREANSRGSANLFDFSDLYRFALLKALIERGISRDTVGGMLDAINEEDVFWRVTHWWRSAWRMMRDYARVGGFADQGANVEEIRDALVKILDSKISLNPCVVVFLMFPEKVFAVPLCENPSNFEGSKEPLMGSLKKLPKLVTKSPQTLVVDMSPIFSEIDDILYEAFPKVFVNEIEKMIRQRFGLGWKETVAGMVKCFKEEALKNAKEHKKARKGT